MDLQHYLYFSGIGPALYEQLWVGVSIATARLGVELLRGGRVKFEEVGRVRRDCHGRTKLEEWVTATGQEQAKPKNHDTELLHDEPSRGEMSLFPRCA